MICALSLVVCLLGSPTPGQEPIRVGVLHSRSGPNAAYERPLIATLHMAIRTINDQGGLLDRELRWVFRDGASHPKNFAKQARRMILEDKVAVIFGCFSSAARREVAPVLAELNGLLFYSVPFEGLEDHPNIVYLGATPQQRSIPTMRYFVLNYGPRMVLLGSDNIETRAEQTILSDHFQGFGGQVVAKITVANGETQFGDVITSLKTHKPDVIVSGLRGDAIKSFFQAYNRAGLKSEDLPVVSNYLGEPEIKSVGATLVKGHYAMLSWHRDLETHTNTSFNNQFDKGEPINDAMAASWFAMFLWQQVVKETGSLEPAAILSYLKGKSFLSPSGMTYMDAASQFAWNRSFVGRINEAGRFDLVWRSHHPHQPLAFPKSRSKEDWLQFVGDLDKNQR